MSKTREERIAHLRECCDNHLEEHVPDWCIEAALDISEAHTEGYHQLAQTPVALGVNNITIASIIYANHRRREM